MFSKPFKKDFHITQKNLIITNSNNIIQKVRLDSTLKEREKKSWLLCLNKSKDDALVTLEKMIDIITITKKMIDTPTKNKESIEIMEEQSRMSLLDYNIAYKKLESHISTFTWILDEAMVLIKLQSLPAKQPSPVSPAQQQSVSPAQQPSVSPAQQQSVSPAQQPLVSPAQQPLVSPAQQPLVSPAQQPSVYPAQQLSVSAAQHLLALSSQQPTQQPAQQPAQQPTQQSGIHNVESSDDKIPLNGKRRRTY